MIGSENERSEPCEMAKDPESAQLFDRESTESQSMGADADDHALNLDPLLSSEGLSVQLERFSALSSDMTVILLELSRKVKSAMDQLSRIRADVDRKKEELKTLHDIEVSAAERERLLEEQKIKKENFERFMEEQRAGWEQESAQHSREETEYLDRLQIQRQQEAEEFRRQRELEQLEFQQKLDDEMRTLQQSNARLQESLEKEYRGREQKLRDKEKEWAQLANDLGQFMANLNDRSPLPPTLPAELPKTEPVMQIPPPTPAFTLPSKLAEKPIIQRAEPRKISWRPPAPPPPRKPREDAKLKQSPSSNSTVGSSPGENHKPIFSSLKDLLPSHARKIDTLNSYLSSKGNSSTPDPGPPKGPNSKPGS